MATIFNTPTAPITDLMTAITTPFLTAISAGSNSITTLITPLLISCFGIYMMFMVLNYWRGAETELLTSFFIRMCAWALIIGMGLNAANYSSTIIPIVAGSPGIPSLGEEIGDTLSGGTSNAGALDQLTIYYVKIFQDADDVAATKKGLDSISISISLFFKKLIVLVGLVPFLLAAIVFTIVVKLGLAIVAMLGPIFFGFWLFPSTRAYAVAWLNTVISYSLAIIIIAVVAQFSIGISKDLLNVGAGTTLIDATFTNVFLAALGNGILLFLLKQATSLASSLSAGGINAAMPSASLNSAAKVIASSFRKGANGNPNGVGRSIFNGGRSAANGIGRAASSVYNKIKSSNSIKAG